MSESANIVFKQESYRILGACFAVYNDKGCGFVESVYHECLEIEFDHERIPFRSKPPQTLTYRGRTLTQTFHPDFVCFDKVLLEIKATESLADEHRAQVLNYLSTTSYELGLLVNFGHYPKIEHERFVRSEKNKPVAQRIAMQSQEIYL